MDKNAKELIKKMASLMPEDPTKAWVAKKKRDEVVDGVVAAGRKLRGVFSSKAEDEKKSSMSEIIQDVIKGATDNSFGRPVTIQQGSDPTPLDIAKFAGALQACAEQEYSVKEAAEFLGLTEAQVQDILRLVG